MSSTESTNPAAGNRVTDPGTTSTPTRVLDEKSDTNTLSHHKNNQTLVLGQAGQVPVLQNIETSRSLLTSVESTTVSDESEMSQRVALRTAQRLTTATIDTSKMTCLPELPFMLQVTVPRRRAIPLIGQTHFERVGALTDDDRDLQLPHRPLISDGEGRKWSFTHWEQSEIGQNYAWKDSFFGKRTMSAEEATTEALRLVDRYTAVPANAGSLIPCPYGRSASGPVQYFHRDHKLETAEEPVWAGLFYDTKRLPERWEKLLMIILHPGFGLVVPTVNGHFDLGCAHTRFERKRKGCGICLVPPGTTRHHRQVVEGMLDTILTYDPSGSPDLLNVLASYSSNKRISPSSVTHFYGVMEPYSVWWDGKYDDVFNLSAYDRLYFRLFGSSTPNRLASRALFRSDGSFGFLLDAFVRCRPFRAVSPGINGLCYLAGVRPGKIIQAYRRLGLRPTAGQCRPYMVQSFTLSRRVPTVSHYDREVMVYHPLSRLGGPEICPYQANLGRAKAPTMSDVQGLPVVTEYHGYMSARDMSNPTIYCVDSRALMYDDGDYDSDFHDIGVEMDRVAGTLPANATIHIGTWDNPALVLNPKTHAIIFYQNGEPMYGGPYRHYISIDSFSAVQSKMALAKLRLLPFFYGSAQQAYHISNMRPNDGNVQVGREWLHKFDAVSKAMWNTPAMENVWLRGGCRQMHRKAFLSTMARSKHVYGSDEAILLSLDVVNLYTDSRATLRQTGMWTVHRNLRMPVQWRDFDVETGAIQPVTLFSIPTMLRPRPVSNSVRSSKFRWTPEKTFPMREVLQIPDLNAPVTRSEYVLFLTFGTRGDIVPYEYAARLLQSNGLKVALHVVQHISERELHDIATGNAACATKAFFALTTAKALGWGCVVSPFHTLPGHDISMSVQPPSWIVPSMTFGDNWVLTALVKFANSLGEPDFRVGNLKGCNFPRSADGWNALPALPRIDSDRTAVAPGSERRVPRDLSHLPLIPDGDHLKTIQPYGEVKCHGGAGTMQTIIAAGAVAVSYGNNLDRSYLRPLTPNDRKDVSPDAFITVVKWKMGKPITPNDVWSIPLRFWWTMLLLRMLDTWRSLSRYIALFLILYHHRHEWLIAALLLSTYLPILGRNAFSLSFGFVSAMASVPALFIRGRLGIILTVCDLIGNQIPTLCISIGRLVTSDWRVEHHSITRKAVVPGHIMIRNLRTGHLYEGHFVTGKAAIGNGFIFTRINMTHSRPVFSYPVLIDDRALSESIGHDGQYGEYFNCITLAINTLERSAQPAWFILGFTWIIGYLALAAWRLYGKCFPTGREQELYLPGDLVTKPVHTLEPKRLSQSDIANYETGDSLMATYESRPADCRYRVSHALHNTEHVELMA